MSSEISKNKKTNIKNIVGNILCEIFMFIVKCFCFTLEVIAGLLKDCFPFQAIFAFFVLCIKIFLLIATIAFLKSFITIN